jgi:hypothetical protein
MSQPSILPGGVPGGGAGVPSPYGDDEPEGADRRRLLLLGGGAGVVVLLLAAYLLLHGGGSASPSSTGVIVRGTPSAAASPSAGTSGGAGGPKAHQSPGTKLPPKSHTRFARDPFKALFSTTAPATGAGTVTGTGATGQPITTTTVGPALPPAPGSTPGTVVIPTAPSEGGTPSSGTGGVTTHGSPIYVELIKTIGVKEAVFNVGYENHKFRQFTVAAPAAGSTQGTIFDNEFSLLSIQGNEVTIQVGDDTPFDLRKGVAHQLV